MSLEYRVVNFYEFKALGTAEALPALKEKLRQMLTDHSVFGTIIIAEEGFNASLCGSVERLRSFLLEFEELLDTKVFPKSSFCEASPFRKHEVKIKPEIVTLKQTVDVSLGEGTHVDASEWNDVISNPDVFVLDARNDYEFRSGTFRNAVNPETEKFSDLPSYIEENLDPEKHKKIAMFCTGGIRCEKFAPFLLAKGFESIYQLKGGILTYLEEIPKDASLWEGECFVFDERVTVNEELEQGSGVDRSPRHSAEKGKPDE